LKDFLYNLVFFPLPIIWFMFYIILFKAKKNIYFYFKITFILLFIISLPIFIEIFGFPLSKGTSKFSSETNFSAVIVLTGGSYKDVNDKWYPSSTSIKRAVLANNISKKLNIPLIILGGKNTLDTPAESLLVSKVIDNDNLILDYESKNTYQSVINLEKILVENNLNRKDNFIVITSKLHNLRTTLTFKSQNYKIKVYEYSSFSRFSLQKFIPSSKSFIILNNCLYEYYGIIKYILLGYITINV